MFSTKNTKPRVPYQEVLCKCCAKEKLKTYPNFHKLRTRLDGRTYRQLKEDLMIENLQEAWLNYVAPASNTNSLEGCLFMMNFNKDGSILATSSVNDIDFWDMNTRKKICNLNEHKEIVTNLEWFKDPEQTRFASCSLDKTIKIWNNYKCEATLTHHNDWLRCMSISQDNQYLISGCVSAVVMGFDLNKMTTAFKIQHRVENNMLNTINTLNFKNSDNTFLTGTRDGYVRIFDIRDPKKPAYEIYAHNNKLNSAHFAKNDSILLSSGRDSVSRLWDLRYIPKNTESKTKVINGHLLEYKGHKSTGYNIASYFFGNEDYVITGSEDSHIYIYKTSDTKLVRKIPTRSKIIHILRPLPDPQYGFVFSGLQENYIHFYDIHQAIDEKDVSKQEKVIENKFDLEEANLKLIEEFMSEYGDLILKVFHKNNFTYTSGMTWENLLRIVTQDNDEDSRELLRKFNEELIRKMQEQFYSPTATHTTRSSIQAKKPENGIRGMRDMILEPNDSDEKMCETCTRKRDIIIDQIFRNSQLTQELRRNEELLSALP